jgi:hypothetical protein
MASADMWDRRAAIAEAMNNPVAYAFALNQRDYFKGMIPESKTQLIAVRGPDGKPMFVPTTDVYNKTTVNATDKYNRTTVSADTKYNKGTVSADTRYNRTTLPVSTVYTQGKEDQRAAARQQFDRSMVDYRNSHPSVYQQWVMSDRGPQAALNAARTAQRETDSWVSNSLRTMNAQNDAATKQGQTVPNPGMAQFSTFLNKAIANARQHPEKVDDYITQVMKLPPEVTDSQKTVLIEALRRTAANAQALRAAQTLNQKASYGGSQDDANPPSPWP